MEIGQFFGLEKWVVSKNRGGFFFPKMDGENFHGKFPYEQMDDLGEKLENHLFLVQHPNEGC